MPTDDSSDPLQFDKADFAQDAPASSACAYCQGPLTDTYYEVAAKAACPRCKDLVAAQGTQGSGFGRFARATLFGTLAGAVGAGLWYAVSAITNLQISLIAILVGYMVGMAVRAGSHGRGGPLYQVLAMFITYSAIVSTYVPILVAEAMKGAKAHNTELEKPAAPGARDADPSAKAAAADDASKIQLGEALLAVAQFVLVVGAVAFAAPFLGGFENLIGLLIIGFGVWEAWKINRRLRPEIKGPFRVGSSSSPVPTGE